MRKWFLASASMLVATSLLSGCANTKNNDASGVASPSPSASPSATAPASKEVTGSIRVLGWFTDDVIKGSLDAFKAKYPGIKVEYQYPGANNYFDLLKTQLAAGSGPDLMILGGDFENLANAGYLMDITGKEFVSHFNDTGLQATNSKGKQYGIPIDNWFSGLYINKDLFDKQGIKYPINSYDDLIAAMKKFKDNGIKPITVAGGTKDRDVFRIPTMLTMTDFLSKPENKTFDLDAGSGKNNRTFAELTPTVQKWVDTMVTPGYYTKDMLGMGAAQALTEFATGKAAMMYGGNWSVADVNKANPDFHGAIIPFPGSTPNNGWLLGGVGTSWGVNKNSKSPEAALKWMEFFSSPEGLLPLQKAYGGGIFLKGVDYKLSPEFDLALPALKDGKLYCPWGGWGTNTGALLEIVFSKYQDILSGAAKAADLGASMDKKVAELKK